MHFWWNVSTSTTTTIFVKVLPATPQADNLSLPQSTYENRTGESSATVAIIAYYTMRARAQLRMRDERQEAQLASHYTSIVGLLLFLVHSPQPSAFFHNFCLGDTAWLRILLLLGLQQPSADGLRILLDEEVVRGRSTLLLGNWRIGNAVPSCAD